MNMITRLRRLIKHKPRQTAPERLPPGWTAEEWRAWKKRYKEAHGYPLSLGGRDGKPPQLKKNKEAEAK